MNYSTEPDHIMIFFFFFLISPDDIVDTIRWSCDFSSNKLDAVAPMFKQRETHQTSASSLDLWKQGMQATNFGPGKSRDSSIAF